MKKPNDRTAPAADPIQVIYAASSGEVLAFAAGEMSRGLQKMLGPEPITVTGSYDLTGPQLVILLGRRAPQPSPELAGDAYSILPSASGIAVRGGSERAVLHGVYRFFEQLGAQFPLGRAATFPSIDRFRLLSTPAARFQPAFSRRALVSDIMTWNYTFQDRFEQHLKHDNEFVPWMAHEAINAFFYIRHAHDTRYSIEEIMPLHRERGIDEEYGGHIMQQLLARENYESHPEYFPALEDGTRSASGNLCVSNPEALQVVKANALEFAQLNAGSGLLHIWGADVSDGAWCNCTQCAQLSPQLQYMAMVNTVVGALAAGKDSSENRVAYLAYHDTLAPDPGLKPPRNVWFEWAPRERCYSHSIDDPECETNPKYFEMLRRYIELFNGRGHIFEYYADSILFGGLSFATPSIIASDLTAYHRLGLRSISCLTFGAFSVLAYPVNLLTFARCAHDLNTSPQATLGKAASERHPACKTEMAAAYQAVAKASASVLSYGDVMRPFMRAERIANKQIELGRAIEQFTQAIAAADRIRGSVREPLSVAEKKLWAYSSDTLTGLRSYLSARWKTGGQALEEGRRAIVKIRAALEHVREIAPEVKGNWGAYDLEWIHELWLSGLDEKLKNSANETLQEKPD